MKKVILVLLALVFIVGMLVSGCSSSPSAVTTNQSVPANPAATTSPVSSGKSVELVFASWNPQQIPDPLEWDPFDFIANAWMDTIEEQSEGRIKFKRYPAESLVKMADTWDAVKKGVADIGICHPPTNPGEFPMTSLLALPNLFPNASVASMVLQRLDEEGYTSSEWKDVHVLWHSTNGPGAIGVRTKLINTLDDFKGLKVGVMGEPETSTVKALGAVPVGIPVTDQYIALQRGTIDAAWLEPHGQIGFKFFEIAPYITQCKGGCRSLDFIMNLNKYNNLPDDLRAIIDKNSGMLMALMTGCRFDANEQRAITYINNMNEKAGKPAYHTVSADEFAKWTTAWNGVYESAIAEMEAKGKPAAEMIKRAQELSAIYSTYKLENVYSPE